METNVQDVLPSKRHTVFSFRNILTITIFASAGICIIPQFLKISKDLYKSFLSSSVVFNLDTLYLNWNTSFPAVSICEHYNQAWIADVSEEYFGSNRSFELEDYLGEVVFFQGSCESCRKCEYMDCPTNYKTLMNIFRANCSELFPTCYWDGNEFDCCSEFLPIITEYGICYSFNSNHARKERKPKYVNNRETGPGHLKFFLSKDVQVHIHSPFEIPLVVNDGDFRETILWGTSQEIIFNVVEIYNDPSVVSMDTKQRRCHFNNEFQYSDDVPEYKLYQHYSYSACMVECMRHQKIKSCNCTDHNLINDDEEDLSCSDVGLICLTEDYGLFKEHRKNCDCPSSCEEAEYNVIFSSSEGIVENDMVISQVSIRMLSLPTQRFVRTVSKTSLDLIISIGGIVGLFFGASLISIFEMFAFVIKHLRGLNEFREKIKRK